MLFALPWSTTVLRPLIWAIAVHLLLFLLASQWMASQSPVLPSVNAPIQIVLSTGRLPEKGPVRQEPTIAEAPDASASVIEGQRPPLSIPVPQPAVPRQQTHPKRSVTPKRLPAHAEPAIVSEPLQSDPPIMPALGDLGAQIAEIGESLGARKPDGPQQRMRYVAGLRKHRAQADAYERAWQQKIERVGLMNYPEQARKQRLSGTLMLSVAIRPDGSVYSAQIKRSSGHEILDEAALRIVHLAAPFAPLPVELREETDMLIITRTWKFVEGVGVQSGH